VLGLLQVGLHQFAVRLREGADPNQVHYFYTPLTHAALLGLGTYMHTGLLSPLLAFFLPYLCCVCRMSGVVL
jgi:hypothetical protein